MARPHVPRRWSDARAHVLPLLRRVTEPAHAWYAALADAGNALVRRDVAPFLHELVVVDDLDGRAFVGRADLDAWAVGAAEVFAAAHENLAARATTGIRRRPEYGGLWQVASGDRYEAARLLLRGFLGAFAADVEGAPLAVAPAGRVVLIGGAGSADQVATLLDLAERAFRTADSPLSPVLYAADPEGGLAPWDPPADHPLRQRILDQRARLAVHTYEVQRAELEEAPTIRSAVAPVELAQGADGGLYAMARWERARGEALLPVVDRIELVDDRGAFEVSWQAIAREARGCLVATTLRPERYRARWPLDATIDRMKTAP